jgi:putative addiction module component (TIGR02574 family)
MTAPTIADRIQGLTTDEKLELLYRLWDEIAGELEARPATEAERRYLDDRLRDISADPRGSRTWEEAREDLLATR